MASLRSASRRTRASAITAWVANSSADWIAPGSIAADEVEYRVEAAEGGGGSEGGLFESNGAMNAGPTRRSIRPGEGSAPAETGGAWMLRSTSCRADDQGSRC